MDDGLSDKEFIQLALDRFQQCVEAESKNREEALDDWKFKLGEQWPENYKKDRQADGRPCLTMNRLPAQVKQVTNEQRAQRPAAQVNPVGSDADVDTAEVIQGMLRHIEINSDAEIAYDNAFECMVTGGFGYYRIITDYADEEGLEQEIMVEWIENPFTVYLDPAAKKPDKSDAKFGFIFKDMTRLEYEAEYKDSQLASLEEMTSQGDVPAEWLSKDGVRVAEYFYVETEKKKLDNGREVTKRKVKWALINAVEILEKQDWLGKYIPIVPVLGDSANIDGKRYLSGIVRNAKDPQRQINFMESAATEAVALAPRAPYTAAAGQTENYPEWKTANTRNHAVLRYDAMDVQGKPVPPPQRNNVEPPIQAIMLMLRQANDDLKAVTGLYDPSLGNAHQDQSGKAIQNLQKQGDVGNLNWSDNLSRSMRYGYRMILDLIPKIYDTDRIQRIVNPDGSAKMVNITNSAGANG